MEYIAACERRRSINLGTSSVLSLQTFALFSLTLFSVLSLNIVTARHPHLCTAYVHCLHLWTLQTEHCTDLSPLHPPCSANCEGDTPQSLHRLPHTLCVSSWLAANLLHRSRACAAFLPPPLSFEWIIMSPCFSISSPWQFHQLFTPAKCTWSPECAARPEKQQNPLKYQKVVLGFGASVCERFMTPRCRLTTAYWRGGLLKSCRWIESKVWRLAEFHRSNTISSLPPTLGWCLSYVPSLSVSHCTKFSNNKKKEFLKEQFEQMKWWYQKVCHECSKHLHPIILIMPCNQLPSYSNMKEHSREIR